MADVKITALTAISSNPVNPATFPIPMVDLLDNTITASGTTKKVTVNQILGAGGTATLASATITGAATVGTTLGVTGASTLASVGVTGAATVGTTLGVTGVSTFAAGTALLPALTTTGDTNTGIYYPAADTFAVTTGGTERYRVDSAGNCGIGVTPSAWQTGLKVLQFAANGVLYGNGTNGSFFGNNYYTNSSGDNKYILTNYATTYGQVSGTHQWFNAAVGTAGDTITPFTQAMTLGAGGDLLIGTTSNTSFSSRIALSYDSGVTNWAVGPSVTTPTGFFISANVGAQGVYLANSTATSWTAWSDERLKDIIEPINNAVFKVGSLRAVIGKFKNDATNTRKPFLIAQDVLAVLPEAVDVSNPDSFGVSYTDVIPLLVAAIQELTAEVNALKNA